jgi:nucleotide-binding universal stress UspA family protein
MYDEILLPYDGSEHAAAILHHAGEIAHVLGASITVLYVADTRRDSVTVLEGTTKDVLVDHGEELVAEAGKTLDTLGVEYTTAVVQGTPAESIVEYAAAEDQDVIVLPTHGEGALDRFLGSVTEKVIRLAPVPVVTARMEPDESLSFPYEGILVATDGSDGSRAAARHGVELAKTLDAALHVVSVVEDGLAAELGIEEDPSPGQSTAEAAIEAVERMAAESDVEPVHTYLERGSPAEVINTLVEKEPIDAVVIGATGKGRIERILLGNVAEKTVRTVPVPVLTVHDRAADRLRDR